MSPGGAAALPAGAPALAGLVLLGVLIFLTYFFGGYVAGRLARFDGGRNGAMLLVWTLLTGLLLLLAAGGLRGLLPRGGSAARGGRLARFGGGRSGAMLLVWALLPGLLLLLAAGVFSGFLPGGASEALGGLVDATMSALGSLSQAGGGGIVGPGAAARSACRPRSQAGCVGIGFASAALLLALIGGLLGGRLGSRYHAQID